VSGRPHHRTEDPLPEKERLCSQIIPGAVRARYGHPMLIRGVLRVRRLRWPPS
jgi:hypothetical protein